MIHSSTLSLPLTKREVTDRFSSHSTLVITPVPRRVKLQVDLRQRMEGERAPIDEKGHIEAGDCVAPTTAPLTVQGSAGEVVM